MSDSSYHWAEDPRWTSALERYVEARDGGHKVICIDVARMEEIAFEGSGPAYAAMEAMVSVREHESYDGYRGAPRIMFALLKMLEELAPATGGRCDE